MDDHYNFNGETGNLQSPDEVTASARVAANEYHHGQDQGPDQDKEEEEEEAISLSGLVLNSNSDQVEFQDRGRSSSSADLSEVFEFFSDGNNSEENMSHAEDIIFAGKLIPGYKERPPPHQSLSRSHRFFKHPNENERQKQKSFYTRRSESLNDVRTSRQKSAREQHHLMRNSRSLDYQKLYGNSGSIRWPEKLDTTRSSSVKGGGGINMGQAVPRPSRWYMMFGLGKFHLEMDFQDMKSRQAARRKDVSGNDGKAIVNRVDHRRCSGSNWDLLRVLSCKDHASVAVTSPFGRLQEI